MMTTHLSIGRRFRITGPAKWDYQLQGWGDSWWPGKRSKRWDSQKKDWVANGWQPSAYTAPPNDGEKIEKRVWRIDFGQTFTVQEIVRSARFVSVRVDLPPAAPYEAAWINVAKWGRDWVIVLPEVG